MSANPSEIPGTQDDDTVSESTGGQGHDPFPGKETPSAYIAIDGISPDSFDASDKEQLIIYLQNMLLADLGYPIEGVRLIESPRYAVEFTDGDEVE